MDKVADRKSLDAWMAPQMAVSIGTVDVLLKAHARAARMWLDSWMMVTGELGRFAMKRWTVDADLVRRLCACRTPFEALDVQAAFVQQALRDYMRETALLADVETDAATAEIGAVDKGVREASVLMASRRTKDRS
jgi:hypothetical protein